MDHAAARGWVRAVVTAMAEPGEFVVPADMGVGGHEQALLDFDETHRTVPGLQRLAALVRTPEADDFGVALAVAGSTAQSRIQPFPADVDFFERIHIAAPNPAVAAHRLAEVVRDAALPHDAKPHLVLEDVLCGRGWDGRPVGWNRSEIAAGAVGDRGTGQLNAGSLTWSAAAAEPGFVKLTWFLSGPSPDGPTSVSKVIDATWEARDGRVGSLDGAIDPEFQQIYLNPMGAEWAWRLTAGLGVAERDRYVQAMEREVVVQRRGSPPNHGKAAKRLYNLCPMTNRRAEAIYLWELFDQPVSRLYEARTFIRALIRQERDGPAGTVEELRVLVGELAEALSKASTPAGPSAGTAVLASALDACGALCQEGMTPLAGKNRIWDSLSTFNHALEVYVDGAYDQRLLAYSPIAGLLAELDERHGPGEEGSLARASPLAGGLERIKA